MSTSRYTLPAIALHWLQAALVMWLLWLGWTMVDLPKGAERSAAYGLHKSLGMLTLLLVPIRLAWRWRHPAPGLPSGSRETRLALLIQHLLYAFLLLAPFAGYLASYFTPYDLKLFGLNIPKAGRPDETLNSIFKQIHLVMVWGGAGLISLHIAGAIQHLLKRDGILQRMLPTQLFRN